MTGGHWHHGEMSLDQFLMLRPVPKSAQYKTPVDGLYSLRCRLPPGRRCHGQRRQECSQRRISELTGTDKIMRTVDVSKRTITKTPFTPARSIHGRKNTTS